MTAADVADAAPVRAGEHLDWDRLSLYLAPLLDVSEPLEVLQFPNGSANLTYLLRFGDQRFVLRRPPFGEVAPGAHDMRREFRVLSRLWQSFDRAPRAYLFCDDHGVVGSDFVVIEYRSGDVIWATWPSSMDGLPDVARRVAHALIDALADLHSVDPADCGLADLGRPDGYLQRQLKGWRTRWDLVATPEPDRVMRDAADALERSLPSASRTAILHNDYKLDNCQFVPGQPDRVHSIFDWDMATLGDPLTDVGSLLNYWPDPADSPDAPGLYVPGMEFLGLPPRATLVERYASRTGFDIASIEWYEAFACWKTAVILQQLYMRYVRGETTDERMSTRGEHVLHQARRALRLMGVT
jgi:aminoglycoside phosphotransferase (APT) family kinase protein